MKIVICDDNKDDLALIKNALKSYLLTKKNIASKIDCFYSVDDFFENYSVGKYDLAIFDIFISDKNGFTIVKKLRLEDRLPVIFYSSSSDFALEGYEVDALGYLLKPLDISKLNNLLDIFFERKKLKKIEIAGRKQFKYFYHKDIIYCESNGRKVTFYLNNKMESYTFYGKLDEIEKDLNNSSFLRTHKSFLVNMEYISDVDSRYFKLTNGVNIPIRIKQYSSIVRNYHDYYIGNNANDE